MRASDDAPLPLPLPLPLPSVALTTCRRVAPLPLPLPSVALTTCRRVRDWARARARARARRVPGTALSTVRGTYEPRLARPLPARDAPADGRLDVPRRLRAREERRERARSRPSRPT